MSFAPPEPKQHHRAGDLVDPLWGLLDMTPEGRGEFFPKVVYGLALSAPQPLRRLTGIAGAHSSKTEKPPAGHRRRLRGFNEGSVLLWKAFCLSHP
jgi:hypothetical protein